MVGARMEQGGASQVTPSQMPDRSLVDAYLRRRDELAFRALYRRHAPYLYGVACRTAGGPGSAAEELMQDTWVSATERLDTFEWRSQLRTWMVGVMMNCWRREVRRRSKDQRGAVTTEAAPPANNLIEVLDLEDALTRLPHGYREVVVLHYLYGYKHEEVATMLGISSGTSKSQASRGVKRLRSLMKWEP